MAILANVALTNTFDEWRVRTNELVFKTNQLDTANIATVVSNTSTITISGNFRLGNTVYLDSNAFPTTGGTITGNTTFTSNVVVTGNTTFTKTVTIINGVLDLLS